MNYLIPKNWTWDQWKAFGRHVLTYMSGIVSGAMVIGIISNADGTKLIAAISDLAEGAGKVATALATIIGIMVPIYTSLRASKSAAPDSQVKAAAKVLELGLPVNGAKDKIINAVADQPEVKKVELQDPAKADTLPSNKVV